MRKVILIGLCAGLAATGCKCGGKGAADNGRADAESIPVDIEQESKPLDCPEGTTNRTADRGAREWCERPDGTRHGLSVFRLRCNGVPTRNETYRDGVLEGEIIDWHVGVPIDGHLLGDPGACEFLASHPELASDLIRVRASLETYRDGKLQGLSTDWRSSGKKSGEGRYRDGLADGTWHNWDDKGKLIGSYEMDMGTGTETWWLDDGTAWFEWERRSGKRHGRFAHWHENGKLAIEGGFADDLPHGTWKQWSTEGKLLGTYEITNGTGTEYRWHDNGKLHSEDSLRAGRRTGTSRGWLPSGELLLETTYYDDREVMRSYEKGVLVSDTVLIDDEIQSETHYDTDGSVTRIDRYESGKLVSSEPAPHE